MLGSHRAYGYGSPCHPLKVGFLFPCLKDKRTYVINTHAFMATHHDYAFTAGAGKSCRIILCSAKCQCCSDILNRADRSQQRIKLIVIVYLALYNTLMNNPKINADEHFD